MSIIAGVVRNGVVIPSTPLPEGTQVHIHLTPAELRRMPREQRYAILAAAAEMAEEDYRSDKNLSGFEAFSEEELDDESESE